MDINDAFRATCRVLFGKEAGMLEEFRPFLQRYIEPLQKGKSALSGKEVVFSAPYPKGAKIVSYDEYQKAFATPKIGINGIKDIDSLFQAAGEIACYSGNKVLGNSKFALGSENCIDSSLIFGSSEISKSEYAAFSNLIVECKYVFGCSAAGYSSFAINSCEFANSMRLFESALAFGSSDAYYSYYCKNCQEVFFCFNQSAKKFAIGNNEIGREAYGKLKAALLAQMQDELESKKTLPSLCSLVAQNG